MSVSEIALEAIERNELVVIQLDGSFSAVSDDETDSIVGRENAGADHVNALHHSGLVGWRCWPGDVAQSECMPLPIRVPHDAATA
jgi:hypothetical protein